VSHLFCGMATLNAQPVFSEIVGNGRGLAHCDILKLLVVSLENDTLRVFSSPSLDGGHKGLQHQFTLGGSAPMQFKFEDCCGSGYLVFTGVAGARRLLVTDAGHDAVHVIDVVHQTHVGFVAAPGTIAGPRGVAARGAMAAISAWKRCECSIQIFEGSDASWTPVRTICGDSGAAQLVRPMGLRLTSCDRGTAALVVADTWNDCVSMFCVRTGRFVRVIEEVDDPEDVEEWEDGWLVACGDDLRTMEFVNDHGVRMQMFGQVSRLASLAVVRGVGIALRDVGRRVMVFATHDAISMAAMRVERVAWVMAVSRGIFFCNSQFTFHVI
jgi:hypothetical protein